MDGRHVAKHLVGTGAGFSQGEHFSGSSAVGTHWAAGIWAGGDPSPRFTYTPPTPPANATMSAGFIVGARLTVEVVGIRELNVVVEGNPPPMVVTNGVGARVGATGIFVVGFAKPSYGVSDA